MKCERCGKQANVFVTQIVDNQVRKIRLCHECAENSGVLDPGEFGLVDLALGMPKENPAKGFEDEIIADLKCPQCNFTLKNLRKIRRLGCAQCYITFRPEIEKMLHGMHRGMEHLGKIPEGQIADKQRQARLDELDAKLQKAVENEMYEEAAKLRDEFNALKRVKTKKMAK